MDKFLESLGYNFTFDQLKPEERTIALKWYESVQKSELTLNDVRDSIHGMKAVVEEELAKPNLNPKEDVYLKARLKNYLLIEALLSTPERARKAIEREMGK